MPDPVSSSTYTHDPYWDPEWRIEWENDLVVNAPDHFDGDEAQSAIVTNYVRALEAVVEAVGKWYEADTAWGAGGDVVPAVALDGLRLAYEELNPQMKTDG